MKGLLRKDLYVADKQSRLLLGLALLFCLLPRTKLGSMGSLGNTYAIVMALMMPLSTISYDEKCKWDRYAAMLPYRPEQIVWSKYLLSYIFTLVGAAVMLLGAAAQALYGAAAVDLTETLELLLMLLVVALAVTAIGLPALYRFGSEKGRLVMILVMAAAVGAGMALLMAVDIPAMALPVPVMALLFLLLSVVLTAVSFRLSLRFYLKRRDGVYG